MLLPNKDLILITWLLIAAKFNENDEYMFPVNQLQREWKSSFSLKNIISWESKILQELKWNLQVHTPLHYLNLFLWMGVLFKSDQLYDEENKIMIRFDNENKQAKDILIKCIEKVKRCWEYFIYLSSLDYSMLQFDAEIVALSCILWARKIWFIRPEYSKNFDSLYSLKYEDINQAYLTLWSVYDQKTNKDSSSKSGFTSPQRENDSQFDSVKRDQYKTPNPNQPHESKGTKISILKPNFLNYQEYLRHNMWITFRLKKLLVYY